MAPAEDTQAAGDGNASAAPGSTFVTPGWDRPSPLGHGQAIDAVSMTAAPLLAGFAVATIGVVSATANQFRWSGLVLLSLTLTTIALVTAVQCGFRARQFLYSRADIYAWWAPEDMKIEARRAKRESEQVEDLKRWKTWSRRAGTTYNVGIVLLGFSLALALAPPVDTTSGEAMCRWAAVGAASLAGAVELISTLRILAQFRKDRQNANAREAVTAYAR